MAVTPARADALQRDLDQARQLRIEAEQRADALQRERDDALDDLTAARYEVELRIDLLVPCIQYLRDDETPAECIARNRKDIDALMTLLAGEKQTSESLAAELAALRAAVPLCDEHPPIGSRSGCPICGLEALSAALSRIDYLCGEPNDMEVSGYDLHCDEQAVLKHVESRLAALRAGQEPRTCATCRHWRDANHVQCDRGVSVEYPATVRQAGYRTTARVPFQPNQSFGCVLHEALPPSPGAEEPR